MNRLEALQGPQIQPTEIKRYVLENRIPLNPNYRTCADGRYRHGIGDKGRMASFGADLGKVLPLLEMEFPAEEAVDLVLNAVRALPSQGNPSFYMHNERERPGWRDLTLVGCGHVKTNDQLGMREVLSYLNSLRSKDHPIQVTPLRGKHREEALIINYGTRRTVRPQNGERMFFVHDVIAEELFVRSVLFESFKRQGVVKTEHERQTYLALLGLQTQRTIQALAPDAQVFRINADQNHQFVF